MVPSKLVVRIKRFFQRIMSLSGLRFVMHILAEYVCFPCLHWFFFLSFWYPGNIITLFNRTEFETRIPLNNYDFWQHETHGYLALLCFIQVFLLQTVPFHHKRSAESMKGCMRKWPTSYQRISLHRSIQGSVQTKENSSFVLLTFFGTFIEWILYWRVFW